jgi:hypothetical protein
MDIFISWSGEQSRAIAEAIREWLPKIMNSVKPWMSQTDISKGSRWDPDITRNLGTAKAGIFCLTPSNLKSESILFEAGAISKSVNESRVYTLLAGVPIADLKWPLAQFQATSLQKNDIKKMLCDINKDLERLEEPYIPEETLEEAYELWWPKLEEKFSKLPADADRATPIRTEKDLLEEILELVRSQARFIGRQDELLMSQRVMQEALADESRRRQAESYMRLEEMKASLLDRDKSLQDMLIRRLGLAIPSVEDVKAKICEALAKNQQSSAQDVLMDSKWSRIDGDVVVEIPLSKTMLPVVINADVLAIATRAMVELGETSKLKIVSINAAAERKSSHMAG